MVWKKRKKSGTQKTFFGNNHMIQKKNQARTIGWKMHMKSR